MAKNIEMEIFKDAKGKWHYRFVREVLAISKETFDDGDKAFEAGLKFATELNAK